MAQDAGKKKNMLYLPLIHLVLCNSIYSKKNEDYITYISIQNKDN